MYTFQEIIKDIPDKRSNKSTTSHIFKKDLWQYLSVNKFNSALEIGTAKGYSTRIISQFVNKIYTVDNNINNIKYAQQNNSKFCNNVTYLHNDVYNDNFRKLQIEDIDLCFIDACHDRFHVDYDINTCKLYSSKKLTLIFDDYGLFPEVKEVVDEYIKNNIFEVIKKIGETKGSSPRIGKTLLDNEGIICSLVQNV